MTTQVYSTLKGHQFPSSWHRHGKNDMGIRALKGLQAVSPGHRPGNVGQWNARPERAKAKAVALTGRICFPPHSQGAAPGYEKVALPGRSSKCRSDQGRAHSYLRNLNKVI